MCDARLDQEWEMTVSLLAAIYNGSINCKEPIRNPSSMNPIRNRTQTKVKTRISELVEARKRTLRP